LEIGKPRVTCGLTGGLDFVPDDFDVVSLDAVPQPEGYNPISRASRKDWRKVPILPRKILMNEEKVHAGIVSQKMILCRPMLLG